MVWDMPTRFCHMGRQESSLRDLTIRDLVELEAKAMFPLENMINKPMVLEKTFEDEKGLIGSILVNRTVELSAIFNDRSPRDKILVMRELPRILYHELAPQGYRDLHTFICDPEFANILVQHFGFEFVKGRALVRRF